MVTRKKLLGLNLDVCVLEQDVRTPTFSLIVKLQKVNLEESEKTVEYSKIRYLLGTFIQTHRWWSHIHVIKEKVGVRACLQVDFGHWGSNPEPLDCDLNTLATSLHGSHDISLCHTRIKYRHLFSSVLSKLSVLSVFGNPNASLNWLRVILVLIGKLFCLCFAREPKLFT